MYQFFIEDENAAEDFVTIEGSDVNHIKNVLRMKPGEKILVCTRNGQNYFCSISDITESFVRADILEKEAESTELPCRIYLFQGLPKNDKMEWIIQKTVELGVYEVIPVAMKNCVVKLDDKKAKSKVMRWQAIAESAAKQSKRSLIPEVKMPMSYKEAVAYAKELDVKRSPIPVRQGEVRDSERQQPKVSLDDGTDKKRRKYRSVYRTGGRICAGRDCTGAGRDAANLPWKKNFKDGDSGYRSTCDFGLSA